MRTFMQYKVVGGLIHFYIPSSLLYFTNVSLWYYNNYCNVDFIYENALPGRFPKVNAKGQVLKWLLSPGTSSKSEGYSRIFLFDSCAENP